MQNIFKKYMQNILSKIKQIKISRATYLSIKLAILICALVFTYKAADSNQTSITFKIFDYKIYTTSGFVLGFFAILFYICFKMLAATLKIKYLFQIRSAKRLYKGIIRKMREQGDKEVLADSLKKLDKRLFLRNFVNHLKIENIRYYELYCKNFSIKRRLRIASAIYSQNKNNSTACYIYAKALFASGDAATCKSVLTDFIDCKSILIENARSMYLMSKLIIECETILTGSPDFVKKYLDYIEIYEKNSA